MQSSLKKCSKCQESKDVEMFYVYPDGKMQQPCRACVSRRHGAWVKANPAKAKQHQRDSRARHPKRHRAYMNAYYRRNSEKAKAAALVSHRQLKEAAYAAYGGYVCNCCGETDWRFLSLDHVNNDGAAHRKKLSRGTRNRGVGGIYGWLRKAGYPAGIIQVLCMNCNYGKRMNHGVCPHKEQRSIAV